MYILHAIVSSTMIPPHHTLYPPHIPVLVTYPVSFIIVPFPVYYYNLPRMTLGCPGNTTLDLFFAPYFDNPIFSGVLLSLLSNYATDGGP